MVVVILGDVDAVGVHPVSYTHLEVYKRQGRGCGFVKRDSEAAEETSVGRGHPAGGVGEDRQTSPEDSLQGAGY